MKKLTLTREQVRLVLHTLEKQRFAAWYAEDFADYIQGDPNAKTKTHILDDIQDMFTTWET